MLQFGEHWIWRKRVREASRPLLLNLYLEHDLADMLA